MNGRHARPEPEGKGSARRGPAVPAHVVCATALLALTGCAAPTQTTHRVPVEADSVFRSAASATQSPQGVQVERIAGERALESVLHAYRFDRDAVHAVIAERGDAAAWWLVIPPRQSTGGYRLEAAVTGTQAYACLVPPTGAVTQAFTRRAYLLALPPYVTGMRWEGACAPPAHGRTATEDHG